MKSFSVVEQFENAVAEFSGAKYGVAVNSGTSAIFLSLKWCMQTSHARTVEIPARTFISVPMSAVHAGLGLRFADKAWKGVYELDPFPVVDSALRFHKGMYMGGLHCLSFQARKILNIGEGGMVLTNSREAAEWMKKARYWGRGGSFAIEDVEMIGWQMYMTPEKAARGLHLMEYVDPYTPDQEMEYPDLRKVNAFKPYLERMAA
jgi:dTDP-4-amino-4,6-dideoxygalactose transaminase